MSARADDVFRSRSTASETIRWSGQACQGVVSPGFDVFMIALSLVWGGAALLGFGAAFFDQDGAWPVLPVALLFVAIAVHITVGRLALDRQRRAKTFYAVPDERVLRSGLFRPTTKSLDLRTMSDVTRTERRDGRGTITFGPSAFPALFQSVAHPQRVGAKTPAFGTFEGASSVYRLLPDLQRAARS